MGAPSPSPDDSAVVTIGSLLDGRYRVESVLGAGGMGKVYKAEHTGIGRVVAIKVLHSRLGGSKEAAQRFQREAMASGRLDHPNIVGVSDSGQLEGCIFDLGNPNLRETARPLLASLEGRLEPSGGGAGWAMVSGRRRSQPSADP